MECSHLSCWQDPGGIDEKSWSKKKELVNLKTEGLENEENDGKYFL